jgi:hypothetical protein
MHRHLRRHLDFNTTGFFPTTLKHAVITPLIKKPELDPEDLANHRPIAGLSFLSKLIERVVHRQLSTHLTTFHLIPDRQSSRSSGRAVLAAPV